ncbi:hypothetical protein AABB24_016287 [Solanum stoloniferum]|uniref:Uncharacterized protein n=1 Tax=Solanum stoloniferum TaxID=62892 RepID=A0ABD2TWE8_9SOLN
MESKFAHIIVFFLLATSFETLMARKEGDGSEVIKLLKESESESWCKGKQFWPELIGVPTKLAKEIIEKENVTPQKIFELTLEPFFVVSEILPRNLKFLKC